MNPLRLTTLTVAAVLLTGAVLISGCQSDPRALPKLPQERTFSRSGEREDLEIRVQVSPVEGKAHWYKLESVILRKNAGGATLDDARRGQDVFNLPTLQAAVGANEVSYQSPGAEPGMGPRASFKIYEREGKLIAEYEVGYVAKDGSAMRKGRIALQAPGAD